MPTLLWTAGFSTSRALRSNVRLPAVRSRAPGESVRNKEVIATDEANLGQIKQWNQHQGTAIRNHTFAYDKASRLTDAIVTDQNANVLKTWSWQYDPTGNRVRESVDAGSTYAQFNNVNQLGQLGGSGTALIEGTVDEPSTVEVNDQPADVTSLPDNEGNSTLTIEASDYATPPNTDTKSWSVNITGNPARSFTYDDNGNTLSDGLRTYQWDAENRLVKITKGADIYEFIYDGAYRRVAEKLNGTITKRWIWDGAGIAEEREADGNTITHRYFSEGEQRLGGADAGNYFYTRDHLGSIREMTDNSATVRARYDYDPYGVRTKLTGDLNCDFGFTGHYYHAGSDLHLTLFRAYDQETGRWLSVDPIGEAGGLNLYGYVGGNPINYWDPLD